MGTNTTAQSAGIEATNHTAYDNYLSIYNIAQQSWQPNWYIPGFDPTVDGTYDIYLSAFNSNGTQLARTNIQIIAGASGAPVPEPATILLFGLGILGVAGVSRRKK